jgi:hypothetical protein
MQMHYILFMMLLMTAPGQSVEKSQRLYTLQTTQAIEFDDIDACTRARNDIEESVGKTDTVVMVSACYPKGSKEIATTELAPRAGTTVAPPDTNAKTMAIPNDQPTPAPSPTTSPSPTTNSNKPQIKHFKTFGGAKQ